MPPVVPWYERYSATGWYVAGSITLASTAQYFGDKTVLLADAVRATIAVLFLLTSAMVVRSAWDARHAPRLNIVAILSVPMYSGFAGVALSINLTRFGQPPHWTLGVNLFLFCISAWRFYVSTKIMHTLVEEGIPPHS